MPYSLVYCGQQNGGHANHGVCLTVVGAEESRRRRRRGRMGGGSRGEALELGEGEGRLERLVREEERGLPGLD